MTDNFGCYNYRKWNIIIWYCNKDPFSKSSLKRLSKEIRFANNAQIQIEEIDILSREIHDLLVIKEKLRYIIKKMLMQTKIYLY